MLCDYSCSSNTRYQHPGYINNMPCVVYHRGSKWLWLLLDQSPFRAPWPIKGQHSYPMMHWEVKSFPVKGCCRTYARLGWHCYSALWVHNHPPYREPADNYKPNIIHAGTPDQWPLTCLRSSKFSLTWATRLHNCDLWFIRLGIYGSGHKLQLSCYLVLQSIDSKTR